MRVCTGSKSLNWLFVQLILVVKLTARAARDQLNVACASPPRWQMNHKKEIP